MRSRVPHSPTSQKYRPRTKKHDVRNLTYDEANLLVLRSSQGGLTDADCVLSSSTGLAIALAAQERVPGRSVEVYTLRAGGRMFPGDNISFPAGFPIIFADRHPQVTRDKT